MMFVTPTRAREQRAPGGGSADSGVSGVDQGQRADGEALLRIKIACGSPDQASLRRSPERCHETARVLLPLSLLLTATGTLARADARAAVPRADDREEIRDALKEARHGIITVGGKEQNGTNMSWASQ